MLEMDVQTLNHPEAREEAKRQVHSALNEMMARWGKNEEAQSEVEDHCQRLVSHCRKRKKKANGTIENT